jgi:hypothetical protein
MELLTILAADYANVSKEGKLNVMGIFNDIFAENFPCRQPSMYLIVKLQAELGEYDEDRTLTIKLLDEDGNELMKLTGPMKMQKPAGGRRPEANAILRINDLIFKNPGRYEFRVFVDKDSKGSLTINVTKIQMKLLEKNQE